MVMTVGGKGVYNALCDVCGFKYKNYQLKKRWDGMMCCPEDWEPRHPLDFYKTRIDARVLPWTRPDNAGIDVGPTYTYPAGNPNYQVCTEATRKPWADQGTADCATLTI